MLVPGRINQFTLILPSGQVDSHPPYPRRATPVNRPVCAGGPI